MPDLGRGFSPARADCGYRAPLAPRLARPSRWYRARSTKDEHCARQRADARACGGRRCRSRHGRKKDRDRVPLRIDAIRTHALPAGAVSGSARVARFGKGVAFSPGIVKKAAVAVTWSAQPIAESAAICHWAMPFGAGSGTGGLTFSTSTPQMQTSRPTCGKTAPPIARCRGSWVPSRTIGELGGCAGVNEVTRPQKATRGTKARALEAETPTAAIARPSTSKTLARIGVILGDSAAPNWGPRSGQAARPLRWNNPPCPCVL